MAADLDGTLLGPEKAFSQEVLKMASWLARNGIEFTIATGRLFASAAIFAAELGVTCPVIASSGAVIRSSDGRRCLLDLRIEPDAAFRVLKEIKGLGDAQYLFVGDEIWADRWSEATERYSRALQRPITVDPDLAERCKGIWSERGDAGKPTSVVLRTSPDEAEDLRRSFADEYGQDLRVTSSMPHFVDFLHREASKGLALERLAEALGIGRGEILAIGDGQNDLEMLGYAGVGVLVANAPEELKPMADFVTSASFGGGVVEAVRRFVYAA